MYYFLISLRKSRAAFKNEIVKINKQFFKNCYLKMKFLIFEKKHLFYMTDSAETMISCGIEYEVLT